jgi:hypothetical protein
MNPSTTRLPAISKASSGLRVLVVRPVLAKRFPS